MMSHFAYRNTMLKKPGVLLSTGKCVKPTVTCPTDRNKLCRSCVSLVKMRQWQRFTHQFHITSHHIKWFKSLHSFHTCSNTENFTALLQPSQDQFKDNWTHQHVYSANLKYITSSCFSLFFVHTNSQYPHLLWTPESSNPFNECKLKNPKTLLSGKTVNTIGKTANAETLIKMVRSQRHVSNYRISRTVRCTMIFSLDI